MGATEEMPCGGAGVTILGGWVRVIGKLGGMFWDFCIYTLTSDGSKSPEIIQRQSVIGLPS